MVLVICQGVQLGKRNRTTWGLVGSTHALARLDGLGTGLMA